MQQFLDGAGLFFSGCRKFFRDRGAWKYAALPLGIMTLIYIFAGWGIFAASALLSENITQKMADLPDFWSWLAGVINILLIFGAALLTLLFLAGTVSAFYEMFGGIFFDALAEYHNRKYWQMPPAEKNFRQLLKEFSGCLRFGIKTAAVFLLLFVISFFIPFAGQILLIVVMGYFFGISSMLACACVCGVSVSQLEHFARQNRMLVCGFGITGYLLIQIPFAVLLLLPGIVFGGCELFRETGSLRKLQTGSSDR